MKYKTITAGLILAASQLFNIANAAVINFDDLTPHNLPNSYAGFDWTGTNGTVGCSTYFTQDTGYCRGLASGENVAYMLGTNTVSKTGGGLFDFNGAVFTAAWNHGLNVELSGLVSGVVMHTFNMVLDDDLAIYFDVNFTAIDTLRIVASGGVDSGTPGTGSYVSVDNFTVNGGVPVPEPSTLAVLGLGMLGLAGMRRKKKA